MEPTSNKQNNVHQKIMYTVIYSMLTYTSNRFKQRFSVIYVCINTQLIYYTRSGINTCKETQRYTVMCA